MESLTLTKPSQSQCRERHSTLGDLIDEWLPKLAVNAGAALDAKTQAVFASIWREGLSDLSPEVLLAAFRKALRECVFWPVKVADIRKHVSRAESNATEEAAEKAWQRVLEYRRLYWNPNLLDNHDLARHLAQLPERVQQAARAAGVWRDFPTTEALHVWAKKQFTESFIGWSEAEQFLLPDGEIKNLLREFSETKALPAPQVDFKDLHKRGQEYAETHKLLSTWKVTADELPEFDAETRTAVETELASFRERFDAALAQRTANQ